LQGKKMPSTELRNVTRITGADDRHYIAHSCRVRS
jgi:hypothetical protein